MMQTEGIPKRMTVEEFLEAILILLDPGTHSDLFLIPIETSANDKIKA